MAPTVRAMLKAPVQGIVYRRPAGTCLSGVGDAERHELLQSFTGAFCAHWCHSSGLNLLYLIELVRVSRASSL